MVTRGYYIYLVELRGHTRPQHVVKRGDPLNPSRTNHGAVSPNSVPQQKKQGTRARHGLPAPCQRVRIEFESRLGHVGVPPVGVFCLYPRFA